MGGTHPKTSTCISIEVPITNHFPYSFDLSSNVSPLTNKGIVFESANGKGTLKPAGSDSLVERHIKYSNYSFVYIPSSDFNYIDSYSYFQYEIEGNDEYEGCYVAKIKFIKCNENCSGCGNNNFCSGCKDGFTFVDNDLTKCYDISSLGTNYFSENGQYYKCGDECESCSHKSGLGQHNCDVCLSTYTFYAIVGYGKNCMTKCEGYYSKIKEEGKNECVAQCSYYEYKGTCYNECPDGTFVNGNQCVDSCKDLDMFIREGTRECMLNCSFPYEFVSYDELYCVQQCDSLYSYIDKDNHCKDSCIEYKYYSIKEQKCVQNCNNGYYYGDEMKCVEQCDEKYPIESILLNGSKKCVMECDGNFPFYDEDNNQCVIDCAHTNHRTFHYGDTNFCVSKCKDKFPLTINSTVKKCVSQCEKPFLYKDEDKCLKSCKEDSINKHYSYNFQCYEKCPVFTRDNNYECFSLIESPTSSAQKFVRSEVERSELISNLDDKIIDIVNIGTGIKGDDYYLEVFYADDPFEEYDDVSSLHIKQCISILKEKNELKDDVIIAKIDLYSNNIETLTNQVEYKVYTNEGIPLNLDMCNSVNANISYPIVHNSLNEGKQYHSEGIDIYNAKDPFFNDLCIGYSFNGTYMSIKKRRETLYQNMTFCEEGCEYKGINYTNMKVTCNCYYKTSFNVQQKTPNTISNNNDDFLNDIPIETFAIAKCIGDFFNWENLKDNTAFYSFGGFEVVSLTLSIIGHVKEISRLFLTISKISGSSPANISEEDFFQGVSVTSKTILSSFYDEKPKVEICKIQKMKDYSILYPFKIDDYPYDLAIEYEYRTAFQIMKSIMIRYFFLLRSIFPISHYELISLNISFYLFFISLLFSFNSLLFTLDIVDSNNNCLYPLFTFILSSIAFRFIRSFIDFNFHFETVSIEIQEKDKKEKLIERLYIKYKRNIILTSIIQNVISIFLWYYESIYCFLYKENRNEWVFYGVMSFVYYLAFVLLLCVVTFELRMIGVRCKSESVYNIYLFMFKKMSLN